MKFAQFARAALVCMTLLPAIPGGAAVERHETDLKEFENAAAQAVEAFNAGHYAEHLSIFDFGVIAERILDGFGYSTKDVAETGQAIRQQILQEIGGRRHGEFAHGARLYARRAQGPR